MVIFVHAFSRAGISSGGLLICVRDFCFVMLSCQHTAGRLLPSISSFAQLQTEMLIVLGMLIVSADRRFQFAVFVS